MSENPAINHAPLLCYSDDVQYRYIPEWARFLVDLGAYVANRDTPERRLVIGLALPTRAYAAAFAALGIVLARSVAPVAKVGLAEHFQRLCLLPVGTRLILRDGHRIYQGVFEGCEASQDGRVRICVKVEQSTWRKLPLELAGKLEVSPSKVTNLPKHQAGRDLETPSAFLQYFLGNTLAEQFILKTRLDCIILGSSTLLSQEITRTQFAFFDLEGSPILGTLQDVLRTHRFLTEAAAYRTDIVPTNQEIGPGLTGYPAPPVTIFDSSTSFLKWRGQWKNSHWIILLDRTNRNFDQVAATLNQEYVENRIGDVKTIPQVPPGIEAMAYEEVR